MEIINISGQQRTGMGKRAVKDLRQKGNIPCGIYGGKENVHFEADPAIFRHLVYTPEFKQAHINISGKTYRCIIKDIQFHPVSDELVHIDFLELGDKKPVKFNIPVHCIGQSPGVKAGGKLIQSIRRIQVKTVPEHMVDVLNVDISHLELGQIIRVRDIQLPKGVEVMANPSVPVATVEIPRALKAETPAAGAPAAAKAPAAKAPAAPAKK
jgi:large subunit ribosomal protein L25